MVNKIFSCRKVLTKSQIINLIIKASDQDFVRKKSPWFITRTHHDLCLLFDEPDCCPLERHCTPHLCPCTSAQTGVLRWAFVVIIQELGQNHLNAISIWLLLAQFWHAVACWQAALCGLRQTTWLSPQSVHWTIGGTPWAYTGRQATGLDA